ncbi:MAG: hypothetical protein ALECFALPRED_004438 [Alectoria fallacina]|uniref:MOSC domain-containing protein n=1 Tax=Alectoria fallacina TaxID=1903189 RepID=A0A8H3FYD2_9LECA|nr:MAG: hypothetical protein ALECFALPRED_004438 [Alectoria fallacina]
MKITQLYTYPIKSLRSVPLTTTNVTSHGFPYDRRFMLIKVHNGSPSSPRYKSHVNGNLENMTITFYPELALFLQSIDTSKATFTVTYNPPDGASKSLEIRLEPEVAPLEEMDVRLHQSPAKAYKMPERVNTWFSECLGYNVMLAYLGPNKRPILGNLSPRVAQNGGAMSKSWLPSIKGSIPSLIAGKTLEEEGISFADVAAYLVITEESLRDVDSRLPDGTRMDVTKFRPNIVLSGAGAPYEEDYWGSITINAHNRKENAHERQENSGFIDIALTQNCGRCVSINVDYSTGKPGTGEANVLKKLMKDRRVDKGNKYSPIFGRYGFMKGAGAGQAIAIGDEVTVSKINKERTTFEWPGMGS